MARVRTIRLTARELDEFLSAAMAHALEVPDLRLKWTAQDGDGFVLYVESKEFAQLPCCWKESAPRWDAGASVLKQASGGLAGMMSGEGPGTASPESQGGGR